jgi:hypothetical protein
MNTPESRTLASAALFWGFVGTLRTGAVPPRPPN